jgi:hypothetical protein
MWENVGSGEGDDDSAVGVMSGDIGSGVTDDAVFEDGLTSVKTTLPSVKSVMGPAMPPLILP